MVFEDLNHRWVNLNEAIENDSVIVMIGNVLKASNYLSVCAPTMNNIEVVLLA